MLHSPAFRGGPTSNGGELGRKEKIPTFFLRALLDWDSTRNKIARNLKMTRRSPLPSRLELQLERRSLPQGAEHNWRPRNRPSGRVKNTQYQLLPTQPIIQAPRLITGRQIYLALPYMGDKKEDGG